MPAPVYPDLAAATADCGVVIGSSARFRESELGAGMHPHEVPRLLERRPASRYALVFGNEADGLNDQELRCCQAWVHLQTFGTNAAYNLANACAIILYQIATATPPAPTEIPTAAERAHVDDLFRYWSATLDRFQYFRRTDPERFGPQLSKFIGRLHLTYHDVQVLRGMLAQFNYFAFGDRGAGGERARVEAPAEPAGNELPSP
jgi:tRNA (cytidine32/uridine32-2'-O)-methyltransferase